MWGFIHTTSKVIHLKRFIVLAVAIMSLMALGVTAVTAVTAGAKTPPSPAPFKEHAMLAGWPANWDMTVKAPYCNPKVQVNAICAGGASIWSTNGKSAPSTLDVCYAISTTRLGPFAVYGCQSFGGESNHTSIDGQSEQFQLQRCVWSKTEATGDVRVSGTWRFKTLESAAIRSC
jgi:hypothetical protein